MTKKAWIIMAVLTVALIGGMVWMARSSKVDVSGIDHAALQPASKGSGQIADHVYGNKESKVRLIEYGDFQCPGCGSAYPVIKQIMEKYKDKIAFVFRNKPLVTIHPNALAAAASAEAAGLQGKYWEMHDKLFESQKAWESLSGQDRTNYFVSTAQSLGLDTKKFTEDLDSSNVKAKISFDSSLADKAGVTGTPSFFLNGKQIDQNVKDGKLVSASTSDSRTVWSDFTNFETLIILPALKEHGIQ